MRKRPKIRFFIILLILWIVTLGGCGPVWPPNRSELTAGRPRLTADIASSKTLEKIEADLARQEQYLIDRYNRLIESGTKTETLSKVRCEIENMQYLRRVRLYLVLAGMIRQRRENDSGS